MVVRECPSPGVNAGPITGFAAKGRKRPSPPSWGNQFGIANWRTVAQGNTRWGVRVPATRPVRERVSSSTCRDPKASISGRDTFPPLSRRITFRLRPSCFHRASSHERNRPPPWPSCPFGVRYATKLVSRAIVGAQPNERRVVRDGLVEVTFFGVMCAPAPYACTKFGSFRIASVKSAIAVSLLPIFEKTMPRFV